MTTARGAVRRHRSEPKGDARRTALLNALDRLLDTHPLSRIGVSDITGEAGVTRSAFYFYFPNKASAVTALMGDMYTNTLAATSDWFDGAEGQPQEQLRAGIWLTANRWRSRVGLMVAMLDAAGADMEVRQVWRGWVQRFADRAAERIRRDCESGIARTALDVDALAMTLVGATFQTMEHDVRTIHTGHQPTDAPIDALVEVWIRSVYLTTP